MTLQGTITAMVTPFGRDGAVETVGDGGEGSGGGAERGGMARVGHQGAGCGGNSGAGNESLAKLFEAGTGFRGDFENVFVIKLITN